MARHDVEFKRLESSLATKESVTSLRDLMNTHHKNLLDAIDRKELDR